MNDLDVWNRKYRLWKWVADNGPPSRESGFFACRRDESQHPIITNGGIAVEVPTCQLAVCEHVSKSSIQFIDGNDAGNHLYSFVEKAEKDVVVIHRTSVMIETRPGLISRVYVTNQTPIRLDDVVLFRENNLEFIGRPYKLYLANRGSGIAVTEISGTGFCAWLASVDEARLPDVLHIVLNEEAGITERTTGYETVDVVATPRVPSAPTIDSIAAMLRR